tara:strand:- start:3153 stop:4790 length:1638 start_codon:yes stop_codon:yes gene_type:complete
MRYLILIFLVYSSIAVAEPARSSYEVVIQDFEARFGDYLPEVEEVVGLTDSLSPENKSDGLFIGISETRSTDGSDWGYFINHLLVAEILFDPGTRIRTTARNAFLEGGDGYYDGITVEALRRRQSISIACRVNDLDFAISGTINQKGSILEVTQIFFDCATGRDLEKFDAVLEIDDISNELTKLATWIESSYNAHTQHPVATKTYKFPPVEEIQRYVDSVNKKSADESFSILESLRERFPEHVVFRADAMWVHPYTDTTDQKYNRIISLIEGHWEQTLVVENMLGVFDPGLDLERVKTRENWLKRSLQHDRNNLEVFLALMETKFRQDQYPEVMAVGLYIMKRWPGSYRSWQSLSATLSVMAGECDRTNCDGLGNDQEKNVNDLRFFAWSMIRIASSIHPAHPLIQAEQAKLGQVPFSSVKTFTSVSEKITAVKADLLRGNFTPYQTTIIVVSVLILIISIVCLYRFFQLQVLRVQIGKKLDQMGCYFENQGVSAMYIPAIDSTIRIKFKNRKPVIQHDYGIVHGEWDDAIEEVVEMVSVAERFD